jgi:glycerol transport system ATP-binding protein
VNLDYKLREQLRDEFRELIKADEAKNSIVVFASTDPSEAMQLGGEIIVIDEGKVLQQGTCKDVFENPKNTKVAQITNEPAMNLFPGTITSGKVKISNSFDFDLPEHFSRLPEQEYIFGVRANEIFPSSSGQEFNVHLVEIVGSESLIHIEAPGIEAVALVEGVSELNENDVASFNLNTEYLYAFDKNGELVVSPYMGEK